MDTEQLANKHFVDISRLREDDMDMEIEKGFQEMLAARIVPAKKAFVNISKDYGLEVYHVKEER